MSASRRHPRVVGLVLAGALGAIFIMVALAGLYTRTEWGRERVLAYTLTALGGRLNGELTVGRLEGNLFSGARLHEVRIREADGQVLLAADSAYINYELPTFFGGDVVITRLVLYSPDLFLRRLPGDSLWNYQQVLVDTTRAPSNRPGRATIIDELSVVDGEAMVRLPWEPDDALSERAQRREIREVLTDTAREIVERVPGGFLRTMLFGVERGRITKLTIAPPERGGMYLSIDRLRGRAQLYRGPLLRISDARGELSLREGLLRYRAPQLVLPQSRLQSEGAIDMRGPEPAYDLSVLGDRVALSDMQWLYPPMPDTGRAEFRLWLETRPGGLYYKVRDLRLNTTGTQLAGRFGLVYGDTLFFSEVALRADPLDVDVVGRMLPNGLPVQGLTIGAAEFSTVETPPSGRDGRQVSN